MPKKQPKKSKLPQAKQAKPEFKTCLTCVKQCEQLGCKLYLQCLCRGHESAKIMAGVFSGMID